MRELLETDSQYRMAIDWGRVEIVRAILESRPRMACLRLVSFPNESALKFVLLKTKMPKYAHNSLISTQRDFWTHFMQGL
jgi:hypothetical protein